MKKMTADSGADRGIPFNQPEEVRRPGNLAGSEISLSDDLLPEESTISAIDVPAVDNVPLGSRSIPNDDLMRMIDPDYAPDILHSAGEKEDSPDPEDFFDLKADEMPTRITLQKHDPESPGPISDDPDIADYSMVRISSSDTVFEPRTRKFSWLKPRHVLIPLTIIAVIILFLSVIEVGDLNERLASPLQIHGENVSNPEFSFMYNFVLMENGVDVLDSSTKEMLKSPGDSGFATNREYFLDMTAKEMQTTAILYDDALSKGYQIEAAHTERAQAYLDWLATKAASLDVDLNTYIKGTFGDTVTQDLIIQVLSRRYFAEDYASGKKLDELKATDIQAEEAYSLAPNQYDLISYRVLRIVFEQKDDSFIATARLHAQEIIDGIGHDQSKFETVAADYFSGEEKEKLLIPDSTLVADMRYNEVDDIEWRVWLFDPERQPGDCTIFDDEYGFPILVCFSERIRQTEPLRNIRFFYINREDYESGAPGISDPEILPLAQTIFDSVTDEVSMMNLETTYADALLKGVMATSQSSDTYRGKFDVAYEDWIFDPVRQPNDKTIIETPTQVVILFYVSSSENPEWFDRVNSFIRMNNYQAFLLEKQQEYPYIFNEEGLKYI